MYSEGVRLYVDFFSVCFFWKLSSLGVASGCCYHSFFFLLCPQTDFPQVRKTRAVRPAGHLCTELHRHLTTAQDAEDVPDPDTEEDEEDEEDGDSDSEEDEEEEEESSSSEVEGAAVPVAVPAEPLKPQFSSEKELHSVVGLITYMHTYCLPMRKQQGWERKDRDLSRSRTRPEASRPPATNSVSRVVLVSTPGTNVGIAGTSNSAPKRLPFAKQREMKANSVLRELLQLSSSFDVSKPYRLHSPPYSHSRSPNKGVAAPSTKPHFTHSPNSTTLKSELGKNSYSPERGKYDSEAPQRAEEPAEDNGSFSVRRSRRLASFPSRFGKRRPVRLRETGSKDRHEQEEIKVLPTQAGGGTTAEVRAGQPVHSDGSNVATEPTIPCCHNGEARSGLGLFVSVSVIMSTVSFSSFFSSHSNACVCSQKHALVYIWIQCISC